MKPLSFGLFAIDKPAAVYAGQTKLALTPMGARILIKLAERPGGVKKTELRGTNGGVRKNDTLRVHVCAIRQALPRELTIDYLPDAEAYRLTVRA
jgi:DNA-binding winged helix-turn-helix (wHTH) protein